jgi:hypothetical protein
LPRRFRCPVAATRRRAVDFTDLCLFAELNGTVLATGMTAVEQYTASAFSFTATSITLFPNN